MNWINVDYETGRQAVEAVETLARGKNEEPPTYSSNESGGRYSIHYNDEWAQMAFIQHMLDNHGTESFTATPEPEVSPPSEIKSLIKRLG